MRTERIELNGTPLEVEFEYFRGDILTGKDPEYHIISITPVDPEDVIRELERIRCQQD